MIGPQDTLDKFPVPVPILVVVRQPMAADLDRAEPFPMVQYDAAGRHPQDKCGNRQSDVFMDSSHHSVAK